MLLEQGPRQIHQGGPGTCRKGQAASRALRFPLHSARRGSAGLSQAGATGPHLHLRLDPGPHDVGLAGELAAEVLIGLLLALLLQEGVVPLGHQLLHLGWGVNKGSQGGGPSPRQPCPRPQCQAHPPSPTWS